MSGNLPQEIHPELQKKIDEIEAKANNPQHPILTVAPQLSQIPVGGHVYATISGTTYLYTNVNGVLRRVALS